MLCVYFPIIIRFLFKVRNHVKSCFIILQDEISWFVSFCLFVFMCPIYGVGELIDLPLSDSVHWSIHPKNFETNLEKWGHLCPMCSFLFLFVCFYAPNLWGWGSINRFTIVWLSIDLSIRKFWDKCEKVRWDQLCPVCSFLFLFVCCFLRGEVQGQSYADFNIFFGHTPTVSQTNQFPWINKTVINKFLHKWPTSHWIRRVRQMTIRFIVWHQLSQTNFYLPDMIIPLTPDCKSGPRHFFIELIGWAEIPFIA